MTVSWVDLASLDKTPEFQLKDKDLTDTGVVRIEESSEGQDIAVSRYACVIVFGCINYHKVDKEQA